MFVTSTRRTKTAIFACAAIACLASSTAHAQLISPDRPGIGSDPGTVPQFTIEGELGSDNKEVRLGVLKGFELDRDDTSWAAKLALVDGKKLQMAVKLSYDNDLKTVIEVPASYVLASWFTLGADVQWSHSSQTYAGEFNFTPTKRLRITPTLYYESRTRAAVFAAWIPPSYDNVQFDVGYDQHRISVGISTAFNLKRVFSKR
jgi:hypothetical protein